MTQHPSFGTTFEKLTFWLVRSWHRSWVSRITSRTGLIAVPYGWHIIFFLIPFLIVLRISFSETIVGSPPYSALLSWIGEEFLQIRLNLANYLFLIEDDLYGASYLTSLKISALATIISLFVGYPLAYGIARSRSQWRLVLLLLILLPFWTSFLIRVYAWVGLLNSQGLINKGLQALGLISSPLLLMNNDFAVCVGIVYSYLPFVILPIYVAIDKIDGSIWEASFDLGSRPVRTFWKITLPLSMRGVIAGGMLVFIPGVGEYVIPEILGGPGTLMIGKVLWGEFFTNHDWPLACALAVAMLVLLVGPIVLFQGLLTREAAED